MDLARNLKVESVSRLHPTPPRMVRLGQTVGDAVTLMRQEQVGCVLVCDARQQVVGIFTERDLMRRVLAQEKPLTSPISECMTPDPVTVHSKEPIGCAIRRMEEGGYRHLPVVDQGKPVGILSVKRIIHYLAEHFPATVFNQPPDPGAVHQEREGA
jgi:CBS domain-containing protein